MTRKILPEYFRAAWKNTPGVFFAALLAAACGGSPTSPGGPGPSVAGNWSGTWQFVSAGATVTDDVTAILNASGSTVSGTWSAASGAGGTLTFTSGASITGTFTISQTLLSGLNCSTSSSLSGTASSTSITFTVAAIPTSGLCQWGQNMRFVLNK